MPCLCMMHGYVKYRQPVLSRRHQGQSPVHKIETAAQTVKTKIKIITK